MNALTKSRVSLEPTSMAEAVTFSQMLAKSSLVPQEFRGKPENVFVAMQWGYEIGLSPMQALQGIAVINGRPAVFGDTALALVRASEVCAYVHESVTGQGEAMVATCKAARRGQEGETVTTFSVADAKRAGLWGKQGPWTQYPQRMLQLRARGFCLRDSFADVLRGLITAEEAGDIPQPQSAPFNGTTIDAKASPEPQAGAVAYPPAAGAPPSADLREQINRDVPMDIQTDVRVADVPLTANPNIKKMTLREFLDDLESRCAEAKTEDEANAILREERVIRLDDPGLKINPDVRDRALAARQAMVDRIWPEPPEKFDDWPGDAPDPAMAGAK